MLFKFLVLLSLVTYCGCKSTRVVPDNQRPYSEGNIENILSFAELRLQLIENPADPSRPSFVVTIMNTSMSNEYDFISRDAFTIEMYVPPTYAASGNLAVWRDGERLWDIEPLQMQLWVSGLTAVEHIFIQPGTGYLFTFRDALGFKFEPVTEAPERSEEASSLNDILSFSQFFPPYVNPFETPGKYKIAYELILNTYSDESEVMKRRRVTSNEVQLIIE